MPEAGESTVAPAVEGALPFQRLHQGHRRQRDTQVWHLNVLSPFTALNLDIVDFQRTSYMSVSHVYE